MSPTSREQLASKPLRRPDAVCTEIGNGVRLSVPVQPGRWAVWLLRVPVESTKNFDLDALGKFVWDQCDGNTSVRRIARRLRRAHRIGEREAHLATTAFLRTLAGKGLIAVKTPQAAGSRRLPLDIKTTR